MTVVRGFAITITSGIVFAAVGAGCGVLLGAVSPDYYRTVFQVPPDIQQDATEIGFGLGVTQGLAAGLLIGLVIVVTVAWSASHATASHPPLQRENHA